MPTRKFEYVLALRPRISNLAVLSLNSILRQCRVAKIEYEIYVTDIFDFGGYHNVVNLNTRREKTTNIEYGHYAYSIINAINLNLRTVGGIKISNIDKPTDQKNPYI